LIFRTRFTESAPSQPDTVRAALIANGFTSWLLVVLQTAGTESATSGTPRQPGVVGSEAVSHLFPPIQIASFAHSCVCQARLVARRPGPGRGLIAAPFIGCIAEMGLHFFAGQLCRLGICFHRHFEV